MADRAVLDQVFVDSALFDDERDYGEAEALPVDAEAPKLLEPIAVPAHPSDWRGKPGFLAEGDLPTLSMVRAWNRMLGIVRDVGEATSRHDLGTHRGLAREFFAEAVAAAREVRSR